MGKSLQVDRVSPRIALFAAGKSGLKVAQFLSKPETIGQICHLYLSGLDQELDHQISEVAGLPPEFVFSGRDVLSDPIHQSYLKEKNLDFAVSVYWPWIFGTEVLAAFNETLNFHPALLPKNRGWYPHVYNLLESSPAGVSLHRMVSLPDGGDIWAQREVSVLPTDTANALYVRLQEAIESLFYENWSLIARGEIEPIPQNHSLATYNPKSSIKDLDYIDVDSLSTGGELIRLLKARTFGEFGFAYFLDEEGQKVFIKINLSRSSKFS